MPTQNQILKLLYENYAVVFPPMDAKQVLQASVVLAKAGVPPIPTDYVSFLGATNGLSWNGIVLYALHRIEREKGLYYHPGIMETYSRTTHNPLMRKKLCLGYAPESLLIYDAADKTFQARDRYTFEPIFSAPHFVDLLIWLTQPLLADKADTTLADPAAD